MKAVDPLNVPTSRDRPAGAAGPPDTAHPPEPRRPPWRGVIEEYSDFLPDVAGGPIVTLLEGGTPLLPAPRLSERVGASVWLKVEGANPTGSFKDRGMSVAMSRAVAQVAKVVVCASTGNTSASAAAYAARVGLPCAVVVPEGAVAPEKLAQALAHGARVLEVRASFDEALRIVMSLARRAGVTVVNSVNHDRIEGQKTAAFEIVDVLGDAPDVHCLPVGNAGNITAYWRGYLEYRAAGWATRLPRMLGFQAEGAAPIVLGKPVEHPETVASAIRIGNPASWRSAEAAASESGGSVSAVSDEEILAAQRLLAREEGVLCEPASAASVAGLLRAEVQPGATVVCVLTGHGLKDAAAAAGGADRPAVVDAEPDAVVDALGL